MAESTIRSGMDQHQQAVQVVEVTPESSTTPTETSIDWEISKSQSPIIWTPRFIVIFALTLVAGLSGASLLTQGWLDHFYAGEWVLLAYTALVFAGWIAAVVYAHSLWARLGSIFGIIWAIFTSISFVISLLAVDPNSPIVAHLNAATNSALLGSYICLSINQPLFRHWDGWLFRIAPIAGTCIIVLVYFLLPSDIRSTRELESITAAIELYLCISVWWSRPSCWKAQPGPTFLFGLVPIILLILAIPYLVDSTTNFFFSQVIFLSLLLGILRVLQGEIRSSTLTRA